jgi:hypothetical protein
VGKTEAKEVDEEEREEEKAKKKRAKEEAGVAKRVEEEAKEEAKRAWMGESTPIMPMEVLEGIGAGRLKGYKLGHTNGSNRDTDMDAIRLAAMQQEVVGAAKSRLQKKRLVAKTSNVEIRCRSYERATGAFKQQWDKCFPPAAK